MEKTNVIKLKYLRAGQPSGREYTFYTPAPVEVGDIVDIAVVSPDNTSQGMVTGKNAIGIVLPGCDDKVTAGDDLDVQIKDIGAWTAGAAVAYGDELAVGTGGKAVKATSGAFIVGIALEAATQAGQRIAVQIVKAGYKPAD